MIKPSFHEHNGVVGLLNAHIKTLENATNGDVVYKEYINGMKRAVEIIEDSMPRFVWKGDVK